MNRSTLVDKECTASCVFPLSFLRCSLPSLPPSGGEPFYQQSTILQTWTRVRASSWVYPRVTNMKAVQLPSFHFATCSILKRSNATAPEIFEAAANLIGTGLDLHHDYPADTFPRTQGKENEEQRLHREKLASEWINELSWKAADSLKQRAIIFLFYAV
jgi:hypothetical protein